MPAAAPKRPKSASAPSAPKKPTSKSKTGNSACSQAASNWQLAIRGKATIEPDTYKTLAKCRGMLRTSKAADGRAAAGYNLSDQGAAAIKGRLQSRFDRDLVSDKSRAAKVKELLAGRAAKQAAPVVKPAAAAAPVERASRTDRAARILRRNNEIRDGLQSKSIPLQGRLNELEKQRRDGNYPTTGNLRSKAEDGDSAYVKGQKDAEARSKQRATAIRANDKQRNSLQNSLRPLNDRISATISRGGKMANVIMASSPPAPAFSRNGQLAPGRGTVARSVKARRLTELRNDQRSNPEAKAARQQAANLLVSLRSRGKQGRQIASSIRDEARVSSWSQPGQRDKNNWGVKGNAEKIMARSERALSSANESYSDAQFTAKGFLTPTGKLSQKGLKADPLHDVYTSIHGKTPAVATAQRNTELRQRAAAYLAQSRMIKQAGAPKAHYISKPEQFNGSGRNHLSTLRTAMEPKLAKQVKAVKPKIEVSGADRERVLKTIMDRAAATERGGQMGRSHLPAPALSKAAELVARVRNSGNHAGNRWDASVNKRVVSAGISANRGPQLPPKTQPAAAPAFSLRGGPQFGSNSRTDQGVLFSTPTALDKQVQSEQAARGKALAGQASMFDRPAPAPAPAKFSRSGELAPGRGTSERSDLASNKRLYRKAMQSVKVTPDSFGTGAIVPFQKTESAPAKKKGRNTDQQITKASIRPNTSKESDFLKPVAEQRPGMASTRETITKVKAKERTRAENQSGVQTLKTGQLTADPDQFQYKMNTAGPVGVTNQFKETKVWNKELAGVIQVWKSPSNSKTFVVNGHHRYELAQRLGVSKLNVQYIQAQSPAEARMKGALTNIAEGRGTSVDAAKFFRDQPNVKDWSNELKSKGINLSERTASEGLALKDVHPKIWRDVVNEMTPLSRAVSIGKSGLQQEDQLNLYNRSTAGNWTSGKTSEFATELKNSARTKVKSGGLFGDDEEVSVFEHRAALSDRLKGRLSSDKNLFSKVARGRNASRIESVGANRIDKESSASRATEADNALMTFDRERKYSGRVNNELNNFGKRVAGGEKVDKVYNEFEKRMTQTLRLINQGKFERRAARLKAVTR